MDISVVDPDPSLFVRIRIFPLSRKILITNVLWFLYEFLSSKTDVNVPSKSKKQKTLFFFVDTMKATDEKSRIRIRIQILLHN